VIKYPKVSEAELRAMAVTEEDESPWREIGRGDKAWCLHCGQEIDVAAVLDNPRGDFCPTPGCDGGGWGVDLYPDRWWG
jgi:hypothetical protein